MIDATEVAKTIAEKLTELHEATPRSKQRRIQPHSHDWAGSVNYLLSQAKETDIAAGFRLRYSVPNSYKNRAETDCVEIRLDLLALTFSVLVERRQAIRKAHGGALYIGHNFTDAATGRIRHA